MGKLGDLAFVLLARQRFNREVCAAQEQLGWRLGGTRPACLELGRIGAASKTSQWPIECRLPITTDGPALQMTHANVGSLVVFDASKVTVDRAASKVINATQDAVVGIFTERGELARHMRKS